MKKVSLLILAFVMTFLALIGINITTVYAGSGHYYDDNDAMSVAPDGLQLGDLGSNNLFELGAHTDDSDSSVYNGDILRLTQSGLENQVASIWSNKDLNNYIDTSQKQTLSVWLYFGSHVGAGESGSEGMSLVLQNDPRTTSAIAQNGSNIADGESMGVWGSASSNKASTKVLADTAIQNSWALEFDGLVNSSGTVNDDNTAITNGTLGNTLDDYQINTETGRGITDQHVAWAYPGSSDSYFKVDSTGLFTKTNYYELIHNDVDQTSLNIAGDSSLAWHHLILKYTPPTAADPKEATLEYIFNDKTLAGYAQHLATGQNYIDHTLKLNLDNLGIKEGDPLLYGFVAANGGSDNTEMSTVSFESIPSLVDADSNAYVVDKTNKNKISSSTDVMADEDSKLPETKTVHEGDKLAFNYMVKYNSGKDDLDPLTAKIDLPSNVTLDDDNGSIGKVIYADGSSDDIPSGEVSDGVLTHKINKELSKSFNTARFVINATANDVPDSGSALTVPVSHAKLESDNFITDVQTPEFTIQKPQDKLTIAKTSTDPTTIAPGVTTNLTGTMKFESKAAVKNDDMSIYVSIDGGQDQIYKDTASSNGNFSIPFSSTDVGKHTIKVQVVDSNYVSSAGVADEIASNPLTYTVNVEDKKLIATSDTLNTTVLNKTSVSLPIINVKYNDGSNVDGSGLKVTYTNTNPNYNSGEPTSGSITVLPQSDVGDGSIDLSLVMNKYDSDNKAGLRVGINTIKLNIDDGDGHSADTPTYVINVQDKNPVLAYGKGTDGNITQMATDNSISFPINTKYEDDLNFAPSDLTYSVSVDGKKVADLPKSSSSTETASYDTTETMTQSALGIEDQTTPSHTVTFTATDPYGRVSNELTYNLKMIYKSASLTYKDAYSFGALNQSPEERLVKRTSEWDLAVNTVDSPYKLTASAGSLTTATDNTLAGQLIYVSPNSNQTTPMSSPVTLGENDKDATASYDISDMWDSDNGVLLQVGPNATAGSYSGKINWNLIESVE